MRILLAGKWRDAYYEECFADALRRKGVEVFPFQYGDYFGGVLGRMEEKWVLPWKVTRSINRSLIRVAEDVKPDAVFIWRGTHILPDSLLRIRSSTGALLVSYNNDDPFGPLYYNTKGKKHLRRTWTYFLSCVPLFDLHFCYRDQNREELHDRGARNVEVLRSYYVPDLHRPMIQLGESEKEFSSEAVFAGHYEDDGRDEALYQLIENGVSIRVFGNATWRRCPHKKLMSRIGPVERVVGDDYTRAICGAKIGLCFLSRLNRDDYTRRCFEIPACQTVLASERTSLLDRLFRDDEEALLFSSTEELVSRVKGLLRDSGKLESIARAGRRRVVRDRHSIDDRANEFLTALDKVRRVKNTSVVRPTDNPF